MSNTDKTHGYLIFLRANALAIALISANILYLIVYLNHPALPTKSSPQPNGWWGWFDQGEYYKTTLNLATGELKPSTYWYGYPILGALFYRILPLHPFLIPNLAIFCVILTAFYRASRSFLGEIESGVVSVLIIAATPFLLRDVLVTPWNTIPIHGCFCLMATWIVFEKISLRKLMLSALFVGYGLYCRPSDAFFLALLYGIGVLCLPIWRDRIISIFAIGLSCAFFLSATLLVNLHLFGTWLPPYINLVKAVGFDWTNLGFKIYQLFIDGSVLTGNAALYPSSEISCTYSAADLKKLLEPVLSGSADMVVGDRHATGDYAKENRRRFHNFGNELVCQLINRAFGSRLNDILSGYRVFSGRFVKNFPILSAGFELETELTLHALDKRFRILEIPISYRDRPVGSESKLNTFRDGFRVVRTIFSILRFNRPYLFFGATALLFGFAGVLVGSTPVIEFYETKRILHLPSAILATGLMVCSLITISIALILDMVARQNRFAFELQLLHWARPLARESSMVKI